LFFGVLKQQAGIVASLSLRHESGLWRVVKTSIRLKQVYYLEISLVEKIRK
jgi:hypothetical protein